MKQLLILYFGLVFSPLLVAQHYNDFADVDEKALRIPVQQTHTTAAIASYIQSNFIADKEKIRAVYKWVTANIRYNKDSMYFTNWGNDPEMKMEAILRNRKGVCENYAALFVNILLKCGIRSAVVSGYTKMGGSINWTGHSWCATELDKQWFLSDPTWDAGFKDYPNYFLVLPQDFINSHMPFDPLWQLLPYPFAPVDFKSGVAII